MSEIEVVSQFKTSDGKFHESKEAAMRHLYRQRFIEQARAYVETRGMTKINATRAINVIADFLVYTHLQAREELNEES